MMKKIFLPLLLMCLFTIANGQSINTESSKVTFEISNMKVNTVEGSLSNFTGDISFDENNLSLCQFNVCVEAASINTGNGQRDKHLKTAGYLDVAQFPQICFESVSTEKNGNSYLSKGMLKLHGVEKEVEVPFDYKDDALVGEIVIDRRDFGIGGKGTFMIGDEVKIYIHCSINK